MKRTVYLWLLLFLPYLLPAQGKAGYFALKPGDWFDMQITQHKVADFYHDMEPLLLFQRRYVLRYHLLGQLPNGNQQYKITQERVVFYDPWGQEEGWMGYDSYYPPYKQNPGKKSPKGAFQLEITGSGQIASLDVDKDQPPLPVILGSYSPQKRMGLYATSKNPNLSVAELRAIVQTMLAQRSAGNHVPGRITAAGPKEYAQLLTGASFPVGGNVLIHGTLAHAHEREVGIDVGDSSYTFPINSRGEFSGSLLLTTPDKGYISLENNNSYLFLAPGDTLLIEADADTSQGKLQMKLSGSAKWSTMLADNISNIFSDGNDRAYGKHSLDEVFASQREATAKFNAVLKTYEGKASPVSIDYYTTAWKYHIASDWLLCLYVNRYRATPNSLPFQQIPEIVTASVDTIPVLLNPYPNNSYYQTYLEWFLQYQQSRISIAAGGGTEGFSFYSDYFTLLSTLRGYPLYYKLSKGISKHMRASSYTNNQRLKTYYDDFIHNCDDSSLLKPMIKDWQLMERWKPGNKLPCASLPLANGKTYEVKSREGKTTCILFDHVSYFEDTILISIVKSHPEVSFVYAWINEPDFKRERSAALKALPNVTFIEIKNKEDQNYAIYGIPEFGYKNVVVLDQWGRIVSDHVYADDNIWSEVRNAIDEAAKVPRFSMLQKSNVMNIIGWSLCSILFTSLIGIWIYRVRIQRIKQAAAMKNTIRELEVKAIRSQMNPHFIFNALNSIQSLINTAQYKAANNYLVKFSLLLRSVLHHSEKNSLPLVDELTTIRLYCELEQLRFDFSFEMYTDEDIATDLVEIPGMILQPLVENAILHGIASKGKAGMLRIKTVKQGAALLISVYDNGNGYHPVADATHKSVGLRLVQERLQLFSIAKQTASLHISNGNGTTALLTIPIETA